jgi:hypothetical protein
VARQTLEQRLAAERDRIEASRQWREGEGYVARWRRMIDLYRGKQLESQGEEPYDQAMVNLAFSIQNTVVASVTTQYPKFTVSPNVIGQDAQATIAEAVLNYCWRHYGFHAEFQAAVNDMCMLGHGWLKVGWRYREETETVTLSPEEQMAEVMEIEAQAEEMATQFPGAASELPTDEEVAENVTPTRKVANVVEDDPFVERVSPFDIVIDPEACSWRELRWIAQRSIRDLEDVRNDSSYDARARHKVQADMSIGRRDDAYDDDRVDAAFVNEDDERVTVWEYYNIVDHEWCVFAENGEGFLVKPGPTPTPFGNPYVMFRDYDVPDCFYPMGEIESVETLQEELNKTRTQQIHARKQYVRKFIAREASLGARAREALASEIDGDVAFITDDDRPLTDVIVPAPSLSFDPNLFNNHSQQIITDLQMVTGLSDYQFGQMPDTRRLATEAMAVEGATNARASFKLSRIEKLLADVGRYLLQVLQQFMDAQRAARVSGPGGEMLFTFTPEDIQGEFDFQVEAGSTQPKNDMIRRQEAVTLFNTLAPFMGTLVNPNELIRYLLQQGYDIKNVERFMMAPAPMPGMPGQPGLAGPPMPGGPVPGQEGQPPPQGLAPGQPESNGAPPATQPPIPAGAY